MPVWSRTGAGPTEVPSQLFRSANRNRCGLILCPGPIEVGHNDRTQTDTVSVCTPKDLVEEACKSTATVAVDSVPRSNRAGIQAAKAATVAVLAEEVFHPTPAQTDECNLNHRWFKTLRRYFHPTPAQIGECNHARQLGLRRKQVRRVFTST